jgi:hypothetical protein
MFFDKHLLFRIKEVPLKQQVDIFYNISDRRYHFEKHEVDQ